MSEQIVYRMRANRQKMIFGDSPIPDPTMPVNEMHSIESEKSLKESYYFVRYAYDGDALSDYEATMIVKAGSEKDAIDRAKRATRDGKDFRIDKAKNFGDKGRFDNLEDYKKRFPHSNYRIIENDEVEEEEVETVNESENVWRDCVCGNKTFVEESGTVVCDACGRPAVAESEHDEDGGELKDKDINKAIKNAVTQKKEPEFKEQGELEDMETLKEGKYIAKSVEMTPKYFRVVAYDKEYKEEFVQEWLAGEKTVRSFLKDTAYEKSPAIIKQCKSILGESVDCTTEDKKRKKGERLIRSEPHDMSTATRPNLDAAIAEALKMKIKESKILVDNPYKYGANRIIKDRGDGVYEFHYADTYQRDESIKKLKSMGLKVVGKFKNPAGYANKFGLLVRE